MNFTKHPKEKHPKLIEKYYEGRPSKDANSASNRNLQLQLMMNNSIDNHNKANSVHNVTHHGQSIVLNQSQVGKPNNSIFNSQKIQRNNSNYLQTVNFFANMGVSEKILNDYINNQEQVFDDQQLHIKGQSNLVIKKCSSQEENQEKQLSNQGQERNKQMHSSLKIKIPSPINNYPQSQNITASEKLTTKKESNNFLSLPFDERSPDKLNGFSTNFGKAEDKNSRKCATSQWQRHIFFAQDQSYEIIVKPSEKQDEMQEEVNEKLSKINDQEKKYSKNEKSLQKFFESTLELSTYEKSNIENQNQQLKKADNQIQMYGEESGKKAQLIQDKKQLFRVCESIESSSDEKIDLPKLNNESAKDHQVLQQEKKQLFTDQIQIKKQIPKTVKQTSNQQRLQNILYEKIQKQNPYINQEILQNQLSQNSNLSKQNSKENQGQLFSSLNTQAQTQGVGDSQKTQINNKSFLSSNNFSIKRALSTAKSNDSLKAKTNINHNQIIDQNILNQTKYNKECNPNLNSFIQGQTIETQESGIQKSSQNQHKDSQNELKIKQIISQLNKEDMHIESLDL
ncbi:hypothetical protein ABPG72_002666 [Tetrahymena utriculariae]